MFVTQKELATVKMEKDELSKKLKETLKKLQHDQVKEGLTVKLNKQRRFIAEMGSEVDTHKRNFEKLEQTMKAKDSAIEALTKDKRDKVASKTIITLKEKNLELESSLQSAKDTAEKKEKEALTVNTQYNELKRKLNAIVEALKASSSDQNAVTALDSLVIDQETFSKVNADLKTKINQLHHEKLRITERERDSNH